MKVTLVRPRYLSVWESLACGYIASYLKKYSIGKLEINFFDGFFDSDKKIVEGSVDSDYVGFSCTSPQMKHALSLAHKIKNQNPRVITVFGGHHPSSLPEETAVLPNVDSVIVGEGETGMQAILTWKYRAVWFAQIIKDLDTVPFPDRKLIRQDRTLALTEKNDGARIASVLSGRGCPFYCSFCTGDHDVFGHMVRKRSVKNVLDEIERLVSKWHIDFLKFADAEVNIPMNWLINFCQEKIRRVGTTVPWGANVHASALSEALLKLMSMAGCREIWVGVESGSPRILKEMGKGITVKQIENVFWWAHQAGIRTRAYFMVGFPSETRADFKMTLDLAEKLDANVYGCTILCPYPGTALYSEKYADVDWSTADEYSNNFYRTQHFSNEELKALQAEFMNKFKDRLVWRQRRK